MAIIRNYLLGSFLALNISCVGVYAENINKAPTIPPGFGISITGLYLKPGANNLVYAVHTKPLPLPDPNWTQETVKPDYHPGFNAELLYTFLSHMDQLKLNWLYLPETSDKASDSATGTESVAPPYYFGPGAQELRGSSANSTAKFTVNDVNLIYDHIININHSFQLIPFIGIDTAYLKQNITSNYTGTYDGNPFSITSYNDSKYIGAGPRLGVDATYFITRGFGITSSMSASIFVGPMQSNTHFLSFGNANPTAGYTGLANDLTETRIVPELKGKLGMTYMKSLRSGSLMSFEAGYMFSTYVNGINQVVPTALVPDAFNTGVVAIESSDQAQSNLDMSGPYLKLSFLFS